MASHVPVLLNALLEILADIRGKTIVDATFGAGGYSRAFLERGASVIAFDRDPSVRVFADELRARYDERFRFINAPFSTLSNHEHKILNPDIIVFDLGISSMQIDTPARGFSFRYNGPLDMRMGSGASITAEELIKNVSADELAKIFRDYGDIGKANLIARAIKATPIETTDQLRAAIFNPKDIAPIFQAIRIAVNDEFGEIKRAMESIPGMLSVGGICACVTFHSLEDRLVKDYFRKWTKPEGDARLPATPKPPFEIVAKIRPTESEISHNPRARSAHLRIVRKV